LQVGFPLAPLLGFPLVLVTFFFKAHNILAPRFSQCRSMVLLLGSETIYSLAS
jgi:hypothetical protein